MLLNSQRSVTWGFSLFFKIVDEEEKRGEENLENIQ
jgi:hypothetical protein